MGMKNGARPLSVITGVIECGIAYLGEEVSLAIFGREGCDRTNDINISNS